MHKPQSVLQQMLFPSYKDVNVAKTDAAVSDEWGVERVKVSEAFGAGDVSGAEREEDDQDSTDYGRVKPWLGQN